MRFSHAARPRVKPEHAGYRTARGNVRIGSVIYGIGAEIEDPDGSIWTLVESLNGSRNLEDVVRHVRLSHPGLTPEDVEAGLKQLTAAGFIEDAAAPRPQAISDREAERYTRGMTLMRWMDLSPKNSSWDVQARLKQAEVLVLGVGGTGGIAAQQLAASGVGSLHCVDHDTVELSNLNRQLLYTERDVGRPKADAAVEHLRELNSDIRVSGEVRHIDQAQDVIDLLERPGRPYDLLVLGADQPMGMRRWVNRACLAAELPWVEGGYRGPVAVAGIFDPKVGPCWECVHDAMAEEAASRNEPNADDERVSPRLPWNPVNAVTAGLSASLVAFGALALLTGVPRLAPGIRFGINLMVPGDDLLIRLPRRPGCPACGVR